MRFQGLIFDFDGVLIESEYASNLQIAAALTALGHPTSVEQALGAFVGLGGQDFIDAVGRWIGGPVPEAFHDARRAEDERVLAAGLDAVTGAIDFVRHLPPDLPKAIASSSTSHWIRTHLDHIGLGEAFGDHIYSGREHVNRGKPAPDIYLHAAAAIGVDIHDIAIIEDSPVGAQGAVASGAFVIGLVAGQHCGAGHDAVLMAKGVHAIAHDFGDVARTMAGA